MRAVVQRTPITENNAFYLDEVKQHLRISGEEENFAVQTIGRAAAAEIEHFAQVALLAQTIRVVLVRPDFPDGTYQLPIGPLLTSDTVLVTCDGAPVTAFDVVAGLRPLIIWQDAPPVHSPGRLEITYQAGFGSSPSDVPPDLAQALMDQAALHYDGRSPMDAKSLTTSPHMARIGARYRGVSA